MLAQILAKVQKLATDWTTTKAGYIDDNISSRAPQSTALDKNVWNDAKANFLNASVSSRSSQTSVNTIDANVSSILTDTAALTDAVQVGSTLNKQTYTSSGADSWTVPSGFKGFVYVTMAAGGGGGGGQNSTDTVGGGGGGGGGIVYRWPFWVDQSVTSSITVNVGAGGSAGAKGSNGGAGTDSSIVAGSTVIQCNSGSGGVNGNSTGDGGGGGGLQWSSSLYGSPTGDSTIWPLPFGVFPAYRNMRLGFFCAGADGGDKGVNGYKSMQSSDSTLSGWFPYWSAAAFDLEGSNRYKEALNGHTYAKNTNGGGGGASWGTGGSASVTPIYGGGGRGANSTGTPAAQAGGTGICIIEWWT